MGEVLRAQEADDQGAGNRARSPPLSLKRRRHEQRFVSTRTGTSSVMLFVGVRLVSLAVDMASCAGEAQRQARARRSARILSVKEGVGLRFREGD